jgi:hypothetical protein
MKTKRGRHRKLNKDRVDEDKKGHSAGEYR